MLNPEMPNSSGLPILQGNPRTLLILNINSFMVFFN